jgi:hypothetical protein
MRLAHTWLVYVYGGIVFIWQMTVFVSFFSCGLHRRRKLVVERGLDNGEEGVGMEDGEGA